jgi:hypothetical protein
MEGRNLYVGYNGGISKDETLIEISDIFAKNILL